MKIVKISLIQKWREPLRSGMRVVPGELIDWDGPALDCRPERSQSHEMYHDHYWIVWALVSHEILCPKGPIEMLFQAMPRRLDVALANLPKRHDRCIGGEYMESLAQVSDRLQRLSKSDIALQLALVVRRKDQAGRYYPGSNTVLAELTGFPFVQKDGYH